MLRFKPTLRTADRLMFAGAAACAGVALAFACARAAETLPPAAVQTHECLPDGTGFFRARLQGAIDADLAWANEGTECTGATRPNGGVRLGFSREIYADGQKLVVLFGIAGLREGQAASALPVNVTVIRQGTGQFFGTRGDDKCMIDDLRQEPLQGIPHRERMYRIIARGFCTQPVRALDGEGSVFISRFDYAGRVDFAAEDTADDPVPQRVAGGNPSNERTPS